MRCIPPVNFPVKIYKSLGKPLPPILSVSYSFSVPPPLPPPFLLLAWEILADKSSTVTLGTLQFTEGRKWGQGTADMVTLIKCSSKASDHYNLWEIDYPINTWHFGELHMRGITRCSCLVLLYHILQFLVGLKVFAKFLVTDGNPSHQQIIISYSFCHCQCFFKRALKFLHLTLT